MSLVNINAEQDVLGRLMLSSLHGDPILPEVAGIIDADCFTSRANLAIWHTMDALARANKPHDAMSIADSLAERGEIDDAGGRAEIVAMMGNAPALANTEYHCHALRELANRRAIAAVCHEALTRLQNGSAADSVASITSKLEAIVATGTAEADSFAVVMDRASEQVVSMIEQRNSGKPLGVPFGIPVVDAMTGGMRGGELVGVAARTSIGKTALANQIAVHAASKGHAGMIISLEESPEGIGLRAIANRGGVNLTALRSGQVALDKVTDTVRTNDMRAYRLWVDTQTFDLTSIASRITQYARKQKIEFAIVDHVGLVRVNSGAGKKRYELLGEVTRTLKQLAMQLNIVIVCLIQVGRDSEKESRRPLLSDLRESGNLEQDLNMCIALHPTAMADVHGVVPLEIGLIKNRYGARCWIDKGFQFHGAVQQLREIAA